MFFSKKITGAVLTALMATSLCQASAEPNRSKLVPALICLGIAAASGFMIWYDICTESARSRKSSRKKHSRRKDRRAASALPAPARLNTPEFFSNGIPVSYLESPSQLGAQCGCHTLYNALALQQLLDEGADHTTITGALFDRAQAVQEEWESITTELGEDNNGDYLSMPDILHLKDVMNIRDLEILSWNNDLEATIPDLTAEQVANLVGAQDDDGSFLEPLQEKEYAITKHMDLSERGLFACRLDWVHWILAAYVVHDGQPHIYTLDSLNRPFGSDLRGSMIHYITGKLMPGAQEIDSSPCADVDDASDNDDYSRLEDVD